jgi:hypothetical protein
MCRVRVSKKERVEGRPVRCHKRRCVELEKDRVGGRPVRCHKRRYVRLKKDRVESRARQVSQEKMCKVRIKEKKTGKRRAR